MIQAVIMPAFAPELRLVLEWEDEGLVEGVEVSFWEVWLGCVSGRSLGFYCKGVMGMFTLKSVLTWSLYCCVIWSESLLTSDMVLDNTTDSSSGFIYFGFCNDGEY